MISAIETSPNGRFYPCSVTQNLLQCMSLELAHLCRADYPPSCPLSEVLLPHCRVVTEAVDGPSRHFAIVA